MTSEAAEIITGTKNKEQNFISAVVCFGKESKKPEDFIGRLAEYLEEHFLHYEIIAVNNRAPDEIYKRLREMRSKLSISSGISIINMSMRQSLEQCMNAGLDLAIGDYVYEFDSDDADYDFTLLWKAYQEAMKGNDIVTVCPCRENSLSKIFYRIFNAYSSSAYSLRTNAFTLISRRALNRAHSQDSRPVYRKAVYASIGLKMSELEFDGSVHSHESERFELAADSLVLYTDFGYKFSIKFALMMMMITLAEMIYTLAVWINGNPVSGWTTTMFVLTFGLSGLFAVFAVTLKYLMLLIKLTAHSHDYLYEGIEKI